MFDSSTVLTVVATFAVAGTVKGLIGLGLPTVSLAVLTAALDLRTAVALLLIPSFVTNVWQALVGGHAKRVVARLWPFLAAAALSVWAGVLALARSSPAALTMLLGALLVAYAALSLSGVRLAIAPRHERWAGVVAGTANGVLTGMTGSFVVPGVMFLQAIGLGRDALIQAMGMLFTVSTVALGVALARTNLLSAAEATLSAVAVVPAIAGLIGGRALCHRLSERRFRTVFFVALLLLGLYLATNGLRETRADSHDGGADASVAAPAPTARAATSRSA